MNKSPIYDPVKRRCIVHEVLKDFLSIDQHMRALWILEDEYAQQHSLPILEFIDQIEQFAPLGEQKKPLRERLTKELYFGDEIGEDPWEEMTRYRRMSQVKLKKTRPAAKSKPAEVPAYPTIEEDEAEADYEEEIVAPAEPVSAELAVFSAMISELNTLFTTASKGHIQRFYGHMISIVRELDISPEAEASIVTWCQHSGNLEFKDIFTTDEMSELVHACYLWAVEYFGPDDADQLFARAVHIVEQMPEADEFPPTSFL